MSIEMSLDKFKFPEFSQVKPDAVFPALELMLTRHRQQLAQLLAPQQAFTWANLLAPLEDMGDELHLFWSPIKHLHSVADSSALRQAYKACLPLLSEYSMEIMQNTTLYKAVQAIADSEQYKTLDRAQKKVIENMLRDFRLSGVHLEPEPKARFAELNAQLSQLTAQFEEHVLDATQGWSKLVTDPAHLAGIPQHAVAAAKQAAGHKQLTGWLFTLDMPSYLAILEQADSRELRREMYTAYVTRASDQGPKAGAWDNSTLLQQILSVRLEMAQLTGFANAAEYSLATKMAKTPATVIDFLQQLATASLKQAQQEFAELSHYAKQEHGIDELKAWDIAYYSEQLRQKEYAVAKEDFRPFFPEDHVLQGLFAIVERIYGMHVAEINNPDVWNPAVRLFSISDKDDNLRGHFYVDLYARADKRGGAWMDDCRIRRKLQNGAIQTPIAFITCNFNAPVGGDPALFTHDDVNTIFHEFGHALQHLLTQVDYSDVSGINGIPWDAVEIASQFMESWCWEKPGVDLIAQHYKTQQPLPEELFNKLIKAKNFQSAMAMVRQLQFALFDFRLHLEFDPQKKNQIQTILDEVRQQLFVYAIPEFNRFQHSFSHIFAGGYSAGYYSYKWAELLACDAFSKFEENGIFDRKTGEAFLHTLLESGGAAEPMDLFIEFRGRPPQIDALLKYNGIVTN